MTHAIINETALLEAVRLWLVHNDAAPTRDLCAYAPAFRGQDRALLEALAPVLHGAAPTLANAVEALESRGSLAAAAMLTRIAEDLPEHAAQDEPGWPPPLARETYHGLAGELAEALAPHTEADPTAILGSLLAAYGAAVGPHAAARAADDEHPARLYVGLVGRTARARKGSSWGSVRARLEAVDPAWTARGIVSGLASGEGLIAAVRDPRESSPVADSTKHILVYEPELARVLQAARRDGNTLSAVIRDAWDRTTLRVMTRGDPLQATGAHVGIVGHITRDELMKDVDAMSIGNGLANRFLWLAVRRSGLHAHARGSAGVVWERWDRDFQAAIAFGREARRMEWDAAGALRWKEVYASLAEDDPVGRIGAVLARTEAQVLRLTVAYSLLDRSPVLTVPALEAAYAFWRYSAASARWAFGSVRTQDPDADLVAWIAGHGGAATVRDLVRGPRRYRGDPSAAEAALQDLRARGRGRWVPTSGQGQPTMKLVLRPPGDGGDGDGISAPQQRDGGSVAVAGVATRDAGPSAGSAAAPREEVDL